VELDAPDQTPAFDSESSVDVALALIYIKALRKTDQWTNAAHGLKFHFSVLDQYQ
jgi:hypothetical protein